MKATTKDIASQYRRALQEHLGSAGEESLERAYELGRQALDRGVGVVEMTALQHAVLAQALAERLADGAGAGIVNKAQALFTESMAPYEMTHRGFRESNATLRRLNDRLNEKIEEVATRVARALHEEAWQLLSVVHIDLELLDREVTATARAHLVRIRGALRELEQNLRNLSHEIRPAILDNLGVFAAVRFLADSVSQRSGIPITVSGPEGERYPPQVEIGIYRIIQEALTNMMRHAGATRASVSIQSQPDKVTCAVRDDGVGFDLERVLARKDYPGLGLLSIRERAAAMGGDLRINSAPKQGTELVVVIPLERYQTERRQ